MEDLKVLESALKTYGLTAQKRMFVEEVGEALSAIAKHPRGRSTALDIIEELADVVIVAEQLAMNYGWSDYQTYRSYKIERLAKRLEKMEKSS